jgi:hypothetical protein
VDDIRTQDPSDRASAAQAHGMAAIDYAQLVAGLKGTTHARLGTTQSMEDLLDDIDAYRRFAARWRSQCPTSAGLREVVQFALFAAYELERVFRQQLKGHHRSA